MTQGRCFKCKQTVDIQNPEDKLTKNNKKYIVGNCSNGCTKKDGSPDKVSRILSSKEKSDRVKRKYTKSENLRKRKNAVVGDSLQQVI